MVKLGRLIALEIAKTMDYQIVEVDTPTGMKAKGMKLTDAEHVMIVNVLRAAVPFVEGMLKIFPAARQSIISAKRIEEGIAAPNYNFRIEKNYSSKISKIYPNDTLIVADPMLASGCTLLAVLDDVAKEDHPKRSVVATVIAAPLGIRRIRDRYPDIEIFTVAVDDGLNDHGYILPGFGDAEDRAFG
ncbi:MAG: uracil phosphoribosyltransferase [Candidatus Methanomethylicaceae archaeon]